MHIFIRLSITNYSELIWYIHVIDIYIKCMSYLDSTEDVPGKKKMQMKTESKINKMTNPITKYCK